MVTTEAIGGTRSMPAGCPGGSLRRPTHRIGSEARSGAVARQCRVRTENRPNSGCVASASSVRCQMPSEPESSVACGRVTERLHGAHRSGPTGATSKMTRFCRPCSIRAAPFLLDDPIGSQREPSPPALRCRFLSPIRRQRRRALLCGCPEQVADEGASNFSGPRGILSRTLLHGCASRQGRVAIRPGAVDSKRPICRRTRPLSRNHASRCCDPLRNLTRQLFPLGEVSGDESSVRANSG